MDLLYPMVVQPLCEEDGGGFVAFAPDLPGCIGDGETEEQAIANLKGAIGEWIDEAKRLNQDVPKPNDAENRFRENQRNLRSLLAQQKKLLTDQETHIKALRAQIEAREKSFALFQDDVDDCDQSWSATAVMHAAAIAARSNKRRLPN